MAPQILEHALVSLLRQCFTIPSCRASRIRRQPFSNSSRRAPHHPRFRSYPQAESRCHFSNNAPAESTIAPSHLRSARSGSEDLREYLPSTLEARTRNHSNGGLAKQGQQIAVLGGGVTGLSTAHYLSRELPNAQITVYEGSGRLGGWLDSEKVPVGNGYITIEQGPRTLRSNSTAALVTLEMIQHLGLQDEMLITYKTAAAARNRFVYYPDRLVRMPGPGQDIFDQAWRVMTEPVFKGFATGVMGELWRPPPSNHPGDESVASFLTRRLGSPDVANNIASAVLHGVYAGDVHQLSAKSLMGKLYHQEQVNGSIARSLASSIRDHTILVTQKDIDLQDEIDPLVPALKHSLSQASVFAFKQGIGALTEALENSLKAKSNVTFKMNEKMTSISYEGEKDAVKVTSTSQDPEATYDKVISTISGRHLNTITSNALPTLAKTHAVTVMVVNLFFADPHLLPEQGFGYLIPRSIPLEQNPECALGVVFDSDAVVGQDTATGTKVTVMLGGHWWDGFDAYPDHSEGARMALAVLRRHLKIEEEPLFVKTGLQRECIPQYTVGHEFRMETAHGELMRGFNGKLLVAGNSYHGVGLHDCIRSARDVAMSVKSGKFGATGLEDSNKPQWVNYDMTAKFLEHQARRKRSE